VEEPRGDAAGQPPSAGQDSSAPLPRLVPSAPGGGGPLVSTSMGATPPGSQGVAGAPSLAPKETPGSPSGHEELVAVKQTPSAQWDGHTARPFLERFSRQCLARWLAEASGHGDFLEYHVRFNHPPEAIKSCPCGWVVSRGHFFACPLNTFNNPLAERLDSRAFWLSFQLFKSRASQIELLGQAYDAATGQPIPTLRPPRSPWRAQIQP